MASVAKWEREADRGESHTSFWMMFIAQMNMAERPTTKKLTRSEFKFQKLQDSKRSAQSWLKSFNNLLRPEMGECVLPLRTFPG